MAEKPCPRCCTDVLKAARDAAPSALECEHCGGLFASHAVVVDFLTGKQAPPRETVEAWAHPYRSARAAYKPANPLADPVRYVQCPECSTFMGRRNFGGSSGVIVDVCPIHGVWFDAGELAKVVEFVRAKGLPEDIRRRSRVPAALHAEAISLRSAPTVDVDDVTGVTGVTDLIALLFELLGSRGSH